MIHFVLSPIFIIIDLSVFSKFRAPFIEEIFKYCILYKYYSGKNNIFILIKIGFGIGLAETMINFYVIYDDMMLDIKSSFSEFTTNEMYFAIFIAFTIKLFFSSFFHALFMYFGLKISKSNIMFALTASVSLHFAFNWLIG